MHFDGHISHPPGCQLLINPHQEMISERMAKELFGLLKKQMRELDSFAFTLESPDGRMPSLKLGFSKISATGGVVVFQHEDDQGNIQHIHAFVALLPRLDAADDQKTIDHVRQAQSLAAIAPAMFDEALTGSTPLVASYFADQTSLNHPMIHHLFRVVGAAFFDQFGIGS